MPMPMPIGMTSLERIVATRAMGATFVNQLSSEISLERIVVELSNLNFHSTNLWVFSVLAIYLYCRFQYYEGVQSKLQDMEVWGRYKRLIREIMFILFLVFTRDVQNAIQTVSLFNYRFISVKNHLLFTAKIYLESVTFIYPFFQFYYFWIYFFQSFSLSFLILLLFL